MTTKNLFLALLMLVCFTSKAQTTLMGPNGKKIVLHGVSGIAVDANGGLTNTGGSGGASNDSASYGNLANVNIVTLGTSLTYGAQAASNPVAVDPATQSWPARMQEILPCQVTNVGVSGYTVAQILSAEVPLAIAKFVPGKINIAAVEGGTNDFTQGRTASQIVTTKTAIHQALQAAGFITVAVTSPAYNNAAVITVADAIAAEQVRQDLLDQERSGWASTYGAKGIVDWNNNNVFGIYVGAGHSNYTYYQPDDTHFTPFGYAVLGSIGANAVKTLANGKGYGAVTSAANASLSNLTISSGTLSPSFSSSTLEYTASVTGVTTLNITPTLSTVGGSITINGSAVTSGTAFAATIGAGTNSFLIQTLVSKTRKTYLLTITNTGAGVTNLVYNDYSGLSRSGTTWTGITTGGSGYSSYGVDNVHHIALGQEAYVTCRYVDALAYDDIFGVKSNDVSEPYSNNTYAAAFLYTTGGGNVWKDVHSSAISTMSSQAPLALGNYYGLHLKTDNSIWFCYSTNGTTFTDVYQYSYTRTGSMTPVINPYQSQNVYVPTIQ